MPDPLRETHMLQQQLRENLSNTQGHIDIRTSGDHSTLKNNGAPPIGMDLSLAALFFSPRGYPSSPNKDADRTLAAQPAAKEPSHQEKRYISSPKARAWNQTLLFGQQRAVIAWKYTDRNTDGSRSELSVQEL